MASKSSLNTIREGIKRIDQQLEPLNAHIAVREIQLCSFLARYCTPAVAKASSLVLGDGFKNVNWVLDRVPPLKRGVMKVSEKIPDLYPIYQMLTGEISLNNCLKTDIFNSEILQPNTEKTIKENATSLVLLSMLTYEEQKNVQKVLGDEWQVNPCDHGKLDTEAYVLRKGDVVVVCFRGTEGLNWRDWSTDFTMALAPLVQKEEPEKLKDLNEGEVDSGIRVHKGFQEALESIILEILNPLKEIKNQGMQKIQLFVTGHSLGGALAELFVGKILADKSDETAQWLKNNFQGLYTFGQPRVGNENFCNVFKKNNQDQKFFRFVLAHDIIPRMPLLGKTSTNYVHHGIFIYMQPDGIEVPPDQKNHEKVHLMLGFFDQMVKLWENRNKDSLFRKVIRITLPYSINDHLPSDYVEAVTGLKDPFLDRKHAEAASGITTP